MKKITNRMIPFAFLMLMGVLLSDVKAYAASNITEAAASGTTQGATVEGTADEDVVAVLIEILDENNQVVTLETHAVTDGRYRATLSCTLSKGSTYSAYVVNYDGSGETKRTTFTIPVSVTGNTGSQENGGESSNSQNSSDSRSSTESAATEQKVSVPVEYTVVKGDTLGKIARRNNMTLSQLLALNPQIKNPNFIRVGQKIVVGYNEKTVTTKVTDKSTENSTVTNTNSVYYTVQGGDSLYKIAKMNKMALNILISLNPDVMMRKYIYPGQKIRVK